MVTTYSDRMANLNGSATREIFKLLANPKIISFAGGVPASSCLPLADVALITADLFASDRASSLLQYGSTEGYPSLKKELIKYVETVGLYGVKEDETQVISGGQQGIDLSCKAFLNKGDTILVENPTYLAFLQIANSYEATCYGVNANESGLDLEDLERKIKAHKPKLLYVVPTFSNPTGKTYSAENRKAIVEMTAKYGVIVIEDDPYSKLRFEGEYTPCLKSYDKTGNVIYITSFSKIISPGLRMGVAVGSKEIIRKLSICKQGTDLHTSNLSQAIVEEYLKRNLLPEALKKNLPIYLEKKRAMKTALDKYFPEEFTFTNPEGGLFFWGECNKPINTVELFPKAVERNVAYIQGCVFYADGSGLNTIRLNYSSATAEQIDTGSKALGEMFKEQLFLQGK